MELLIAVSLVSLLSVGMLTAIRVGLNAMEKTNVRFTSNRRIVAVQRIIEGQIAGLMPVTSTCQGAATKFIFFQGGPESLRFVSAYSLQEAARGYPRILEFEVIPAPEGVRLIVNEMIYPGPVSAGSLCAGLQNGIPTFAFGGAHPQSFVLADKLAFCRFIYRKELPAPDLEEWIPSWIQPDRLPSGIRVEMAPLVPDRSKLQTSTLTVPVRVTKWALGDYVDQ